MKRRSFSLVLALAMCLGLAVPALAAFSPDLWAADIHIAEDDCDVVNQKIPYVNELFTSKDPVELDYYISLKRGAPVTVTNTGSRPNAIVFIYFFEYNFITEPTTVYDEDGTSREIKDVYYSTGYPTALTDRTDIPGTVPSDYTPNGEDLYWADLDQDAVSVSAAQECMLVLRAGESVTFTMPEDCKEDALYIVNVETFHPDLGTEDSYNYACYFKMEGPAPEPVEPETPVEPEPAAAPVFTDVAENAYYAAPVAWAVSKGITAGTSETTFSPAQTCTNAQILTFLHRAYGEPAPTGENPFTNVSENDYYYNAALWASENGMVSGTTFDADAPCTRAMTVTYLWQAAGSPETEPSGKFADVPADAPYAQAVAWAVEKGVTSGTSDTTFSPEDTCQRGQIATFLYNALA